MSLESHAPLRVGLLGVGTVGSAFAELVAARPELRLVKALVRDPAKPRRIARAHDLLTTDPDEVIASSDLVVELMGGTGVAVEVMREALDRGLSVVTANKAALAERWHEFAGALKTGRLYIEASVMAGTPVIGPIAGVLRGSAPHEIHAVLNGTCSFVLGRLAQGACYDAALAEAQRRGYAEADPTLDVSGIDAAHKLAILARLTVDPDLSWEQVRHGTSGIERLRSGSVQQAMGEGERIELVGSIVPDRSGWSTSVRPVRLPAGHPLVTGDEARATLLYRGAGGEVIMSGPGAGGVETASAVLGEVLAALAGRPGPAPLTAAVPVPVEAARYDHGELQPA
jgi:homoserine dehydrogenase